jgi:hypothetical protein
MKTKDMKRLEKVLPDYLANRNRGLHAGIIAERLGLPLKDVISFLIEKNVLRDEQVDLELTRVILARNSALRQSIVKRIDMPYEKLDRALAIQDDKILKEVGGKTEINELYALFPQFIIFLGVLEFPYAVALMICTTLAMLLLGGALQKVMLRSTIETVTKILRES